MEVLTNGDIKLRDYSKRDLREVSFKNQDLASAIFADSDLRGADFSGANLTAADLTRVKTGITRANTSWLFLVFLAISLLSGYFAMLAGTTVYAMFQSPDPYMRYSGVAAMIIFASFIALSVWKGVGIASRNLILPACAFAVVLGVVAYVSGLGPGQGMMYLVLSCLLILVMFIVGTVARAAAGSLSNVLFWVVALSGGMFGRNIGGGIGTVIMAIACAQISKRALNGTKGFESLRMVSFFITKRFGTSFRNATLVRAKFTGANLRNADFSGADISGVTWDDCKKINCHE
jgi:hypothetical protein